MRIADLSDPSFIELMTRRPWKLIWSVRVMAAVAVITQICAVAVFKSGAAHAFCGGATLGVLSGLLAQSFAGRNPEAEDDRRAPINLRLFR